MLLCTNFWSLFFLSTLWKLEYIIWHMGPLGWQPPWPPSHQTHSQHQSIQYGQGLKLTYISVKYIYYIYIWRSCCTWFSRTKSFHQMLFTCRIIYIHSNSNLLQLIIMCWKISMAAKIWFHTAIGQRPSNIFSNLHCCLCFEVNTVKLFLRITLHIALVVFTDLEDSYQLGKPWTVHL